MSAVLRGTWVPVTTRLPPVRETCRVRQPDGQETLARRSAEWHQACWEALEWRGSVPVAAWFDSKAEAP